MSSPVVAGQKSESRLTTALPTGSGLVVSQPRGAWRVHSPSISSKPLIPLAARVLIGPGDAHPVVGGPGDSGVEVEADHGGPRPQEIDESDGEGLQGVGRGLEGGG